jgi:hypothetical protein
MSVLCQEPTLRVSLITARLDWKNKLKQRTIFAVRERSQPTAMTLYNCSANGKPQTHSFRFCCVKRVKYALQSDAFARGKAAVEEFEKRLSTLFKTAVHHRISPLP